MATLRGGVAEALPRVGSGRRVPLAKRRPVLGQVASLRTVLAGKEQSERESGRKPTPRTPSDSTGAEE